MEYFELFTNILTILFLVVLLSRNSGCGKHKLFKEENKLHVMSSRKEVIHDTQPN